MLGSKAPLFIFGAVALAYVIHSPLPANVMGADSATGMQIFNDVFQFLAIPKNICLRLQWKDLGMYFFRKQLNIFIKLISWKARENADLVEIENTKFDGVPVRIYLPKKRTGKGAIVFYHGGGWVVGSVDSYDSVLFDFARRLEKPIVSVEYRLAPEHLFPAAPDDCDKATRYMIDKAFKKYNVDPSEIAIAGDSAGGNLAAVVAQRLRDKPASRPVKAQILIYPVTQMVNFQLPSAVQLMPYDRTMLLAPYNMAFVFAYYLDLPLKYMDVFLANDHIHPSIKNNPTIKYTTGSNLPAKYTKHPMDTSKVNIQEHLKPYSSELAKEVQEKVKDFVVNPDVNPLQKKDLSGLPPAYVAVCAFDGLRDEGILYAQRMEQAKVPVNLKYYEEAMHGAFSMPDHPIGVQVTNDILEFAKSSIN